MACVFGGADLTHCLGHLSTTQIFVWDTTTTTITVLWEKINAEVETWTVTVYQDVDVKPGQLYPSAVQVEVGLMPCFTTSTICERTSTYDF